MNQEVDQDEKDQSFASTPRDTFVFEEDVKHYRVMASPIPGGFNILNNKFLSRQQLRERGEWESGMVDELRRKQHCVLRALMMEEAKKIQGASQEWSVEGLATMKKVSEEIEELEHQMKESAERGVCKIKALQQR